MVCLNNYQALCLNIFTYRSDIRVESVTAVGKSSDLLIKMLLLLDLNCGVSEDLALVFCVREAHVVSEMRDHHSLVNVVLFEELRLFLLHALQHNLVVSSCIEHAHVVEFLCLNEFRMRIVCFYP